MYCPLCGTPNNDNAAQCVKCGHSFQAGAVTPPSSAEIPDKTIAAPEAMPPERSYPPPPTYPPPTPYPPAQQYPSPAASVNQPARHAPPDWQAQPGSSQMPPQWAPQPYSQQSYPPQTQGPMPPGQGGDAFGTLIPYNNSSALIAYYLAVFSLIPCFGLILGIGAFILGLKGLKFAKAHPEAKGTAHAWVGIILGGLCALVNITLLILAIIGAMSSH